MYLFLLTTFSNVYNDLSDITSVLVLSIVGTGGRKCLFLQYIYHLFAVW